MGRSMKSNIDKGIIKTVWNEAFKTLDYYKRSTRGKFILCNPWTGRFIQKGPGLSSESLDKLSKKN